MHCTNLNRLNYRIRIQTIWIDVWMLFESKIRSVLGSFFEFFFTCALFPKAFPSLYSHVYYSLFSSSLQIHSHTNTIWDKMWMRWVRQTSGRDRERKKDSVCLPTQPLHNCIVEVSSSNSKCVYHFCFKWNGSVAIQIAWKRYIAFSLCLVVDAFSKNTEDERRKNSGPKFGRDDILYGIR